MMRVVKVFGGGRGGGRIVPCDTGSRWEGTVIVHSIFLPLCQPPLPFPYSLTPPPIPLPLLPHKNNHYKPSTLSLDALAAIRTAELARGSAWTFPLGRLFFPRQVRGP